MKLKLCELVIRPLSAFGTPIKGDTLFGQFCWQAAIDDSIIKRGLNEWIKLYPERPFAVFSSGFPIVRTQKGNNYAFPVPTCPLHFYESLEENCFEVLARLKDIKKKRWVLIPSTDGLVLNIKKSERLGDAELLQRFGIFSGAQFPQKPFIYAGQPHNTINRLTHRTGENFAPYVMENLWYFPGMELAIFVLFDEEALSEESIKKAMENIGKTGFGRDASLGLGRFEVVGIRELRIPDLTKTKTFYTLAPFVPNKEMKVWYRPFVRYGRHGNILAISSNPFKNPILMADEGAVVELDTATNYPFIGKALTGISKVQPEAVAQGYTIIIPCEL